MFFCTLPKPGEFSPPENPQEVATLQPFVDKKFAELEKPVEYAQTPDGAQKALEAKRRLMKACDVAMFYKLRTPDSCWAKPAPK